MKERKTERLSKMCRLHSILICKAGIQPGCRGCSLPNRQIEKRELRPALAFTGLLLPGSLPTGLPSCSADTTWQFIFSFLFTWVPSLTPLQLQRRRTANAWLQPICIAAPGCGKTAGTVSPQQPGTLTVKGTSSTRQAQCTRSVLLSRPPFNLGLSLDKLCDFHGL